jgi:hypothetical protein
LSPEYIAKFILDTNNRKILIITYYWPPAGGPGVQRWVKFTKYLSSFGYEPFILTVDEKLASYALSDGTLLNEIPPSVKIFRTKTHEFYNTYLRLTKKENIPFSGFVNESKPGLKQKVIRFIRSHLFIPDPRKGWNKYAFEKAQELINKEGIQLVITTSPPHSTQLIGERLKKKYSSIKWIADFRDPWTDIFYFDQLCHSSVSKGINILMERSVLQYADHALVVSKSMKSDFLHTHGSYIVPDKIHILPNGYDATDFTETVLPDKGVFTITYTGTLAANYKIDSLLLAAKNIIETTNYKLRLQFVGEISPEYKALLSNEPLRISTVLIPRVSHETAIEYLLRSHLLLLVIPKAKKNEAIITGKLFEYMAAKRPHLLNETLTGKMFGYSDTAEIKGYLMELLEKHNQGDDSWPGRDIKQYSRENLAKQLTRLF